MPGATLKILRDEHLAIATVLYTLRYLVQHEDGEDQAPRFPVLHAIVDYIVSYPDRWHHPKEETQLFRCLRLRTQEADALIADLELEHCAGYNMIEDLRDKLQALERGEAGAREKFRDAALRYAQFEWSHLRREEDLLFPLAEEYLQAEDWASIHKAFRENDNPLFGLKPRDHAEQLYQRILELAPAPIGRR
ncbi:MAG: hemerythrin domain-containing protein [Betaproteobacteria bacterium]|nr:hemerythrin domain-containing protein [Betaproteobacteria bacterium]